MKTEKRMQLFSWYETSQEKAINMKTVPYMGIEPVRDLVEKVLKENGRVLYITGEDKDRVLIVRAMRDLGIDSISVHQDMEINEKGVSGDLRLPSGLKSKRRI